MSKRYLLIIFILFTSMGYCQDKNTITFEDQTTKVFFRMSADKTILKVGDTLILSLDIKNRDSARSVFLFKPDHLHACSDSVCWFVIDEGGDWMVELGRIQPLSLFSLIPNHDFHFKYRIKIETMQEKEKQICRVPIATEDYNNIASRYLLIYIGYYIDDGLFTNVNFKELYKSGFSEKNAFKFEQGLKRLVLGPLHVLVK